MQLGQAKFGSGSEHEWWNVEKLSVKIMFSPFKDYDNALWRYTMM